MSITKDFFIAELTAALQKAVPMPVETITLEGGVLAVKFRIEGPNADTLFWKAAKEQSEE